MRKVYGQSQEILCPFCGTQATTKNAQGLPVCHRHTDKEINLKCVCGGWLDVKESKFGTFFLCMDCGPVSYKKCFEINDLPIKSYEDL
jgi:hypothetical protein